MKQQQDRLPSNPPPKRDTEKKENEDYSFTRKIGNELVTFEVVDSVYNFSPKQWARVVCLFTNGELFQLKDWPPKEDDAKLSDQARQTKIVNVFHRVKGFFLHYQDVLEPPTVKTWNVSRLVVQRNKRHQDINVQNTIWKELEVFLRRERFKDSDCKF